MAHQSLPPRMRIYTHVFAIGCSVLVAGAGEAMGGRPPLSAACRAWNSHIADLIDQHRTAHELDDDQFSEIIRRYYDAQSTCSAQHFEEGLAIYEAIPIGPVANRLLR